MCDPLACGAVAAPDSGREAAQPPGHAPPAGRAGQAIRPGHRLQVSEPCVGARPGLEAASRAACGCLEGLC
eukprot:358069-Chlamydomonas_euryale.AAC.4